MAEKKAVRLSATDEEVVQEGYQYLLILLTLLTILTATHTPAVISIQWPRSGIIEQSDGLRQQSIVVNLLANSELLKRTHECDRLEETGSKFDGRRRNRLYSSKKKVSWISTTIDQHIHYQYPHLVDKASRSLSGMMRMTEMESVRKYSRIQPMPMIKSVKRLNCQLTSGPTRCGPRWKKQMETPSPVKKSVPKGLWLYAWGCVKMLWL